ncbi:MAG: hypothetical protein ACLS3C_05545 [Oscillospiraceae bacterium]
MDELERALRAVLDDPAQLQELRELAGSMGFSVPQAQPERAPVPDPRNRSRRRCRPFFSSSRCRSLPPQCCGRREKWTKGRKRCCWR